jgi:hypothetical protein
MSTTERILDWGMISEAGIDTERVERRTNPLDTSIEQYAIISSDGQTEILFGEYYDREEGGWDIGVYELADETPAAMIGAPDWFEMPAALLAAVRAWAEKN